MLTSCSLQFDTASLLSPPSSSEYAFSEDIDFDGEKETLTYYKEKSTLHIVVMKENQTIYDMPVIGNNVEDILFLKNQIVIVYSLLGLTDKLLEVYNYNPKGKAVLETTISTPCTYYGIMSNELFYAYGNPLTIKYKNETIVLPDETQAADISDIDGDNEFEIETLSDNLSHWYSYKNGVLSLKYKGINSGKYRFIFPDIWSNVGFKNGIIYDEYGGMLMEINDSGEITLHDKRLSLSEVYLRLERK
jgi:hypothetical protein